MLLYVPLKAYSPTTLGSTHIYYTFDFCYYIKILFKEYLKIKQSNFGFIRLKTNNLLFNFKHLQKNCYIFHNNDTLCRESVL